MTHRRRRPHHAGPSGSPPRHHHQLTINSLEPPLLLVSLASTSRALTHVLGAGAFALRVLGCGQEAIARRFAAPNRPVGNDSFMGVVSRPGTQTGCPILDQSCGYFECSVGSIQTVADHCLIIASVLSCEATPSTPPLMFANGAFTGPEASADESGKDAGCLHRSLAKRRWPVLSLRVGEFQR
jgi:flavin reductase (DIM6/NTAB) family NADH-FMN oxidoreductase RutF